MELKPYPEYKDTVIPWIGKVPKEWRLNRLGSVLLDRKETVSDKDFQPLSVTKKGILPQLATAAKSNDGDNRKKVNEGDFVINSRSDRKGSSGLSTLKGSVSLINTVLIPSGINSNYTHYLLKSHPFKEEFYHVGKGIVADLWSTKYSEMRTILLPLPPLPEQIQIARFLDWKTSQIAKFIKAKKKMIALLKEQKQVIINDAVTGKIDVTTGKPYAKYKDSGVEWLGMVPEGWEIKKFKRIANITSGQIDPKDTSFMNNILIAPNHIQSGTGKLIFTQTVKEQGAISGKYHVKKGQVIYSKIRPNLQKVCIASEECLCSADMYPITVNENEMSSRYLMLFILSKPFTKYAVNCSMRVAMPKINRDALGNCFVWYPKVTIQNNIIDYIESQTNNIDVAIYHIEKEISLIQEYRDRLIADVVTGQVDVRGIEVPDVFGEETNINNEDITENDELYLNEEAE